MNKEIFGELKRFSTVDYPSKLTSVIYFKSCNLACSYCYNLKGLRDSKGYTMEDIINDIKVYNERFPNILDGITISGGEPALYPEEVSILMERIKEIGNYKIKVDTNGTSPEFIRNIIKDGVDFIAMDYKTYRYMCNLAVEDSIINESLDIIAQSNIKNEIRITLYPGYIDTTTFVDMMFNLKAKGFTKVTLQKFLNENVFHNNGILPFSEDEINYYVDKAKQMGLEVTLR